MRTEDLPLNMRDDEKKPEVHQSMMRAAGECWFKCKGMLDRVKGHEVPMFRFGSLAHEYFYAYAERCQNDGVTKSEEWADNMAAVCDDSRLAKLIRQLPLTIVIRPEYEVKGLEHGFSIELEHCVVAGRLDRLEYDPIQHLWRVIDYKTGFKPLRQEEAPFQLQLYAAAVNHLQGQEGDAFECWYVYPEANAALPPSMWTLTQEDLGPVLPAVDEWAVAVQAMTRFEATPSQQACQACPYLFGVCPLWGEADRMPVIQSEALAEFAWQVRQWADQAVKTWAAEHGPVAGYEYGAPKYVEDGLTHWQVAGNQRTKAGKQVAADLINKVFRLAAQGAGVVLSTALQVKPYWLNKVMADEESEIAKAIREYVEPVPAEAEWREHIGGGDDGTA